MAKQELQKRWEILSEKIKDILSGDICAEIGLYDFDVIVKEKSESED